MAYDASSEGWLSSAWSDLKAGRNFYVTVSERSAKDIIARITSVSQKFTGVSSVVKTLSDHAPGNIIPDPTDLAKALAVLGSFGAMEASFVVLALFAHFKGYTIEVGFVIPPYTVDITACVVRLCFERKAA